MTESNTKTP